MLGVNVFRKFSVYHLGGSGECSSDILGDQNYRRIGRRKDIFECAHRGARTAGTRRKSRSTEVVEFARDSVRLEPTGNI